MNVIKGNILSKKIINGMIFMQILGIYTQLCFNMLIPDKTASIMSHKPYLGVKLRGEGI